MSDLDKLHTMLTDHLLERITDGETVVTKAGTIVAVPVSPAVLNVARAFLKDNGIEVEDNDDAGATSALAAQVREQYKREEDDKSRLN